MKELLSRVDHLLAEKDRVVIVIDGPCASGKTTLASKIAERHDCHVIHMDDFFLRPHQRTKTRLAEPGGNLDRERFWEEVLTPLIRREEFSYRPYLCGEGRLGEEIRLKRKKLYVIEGSYSHHPFFGKASYDLRVFLQITPEEQKRRLALRSPEKLSRFLTEWIPMENAYFEAFSIAKAADLILTVETDS